MFKLNLKFKNNKRGITLIALVITIVILIILATVSINVVLGEGGLIQRAQEGKDLTEQAQIDEKEEITGAEEYINSVIGGKDPSEPFEPRPTPEPPTGGTSMEDMTNGVIEIKWLNGTSYNVSDTPNAPLIKEDLPEGTTMELVRYTGEGTTERERWVAGTEYSYLPGTGSSDNRSSKWANARVTIDGIDSYFVWIPRYAYRIIYFDSKDSKIAYQEGKITEAEAVANKQIIGYSDSRGIVDAEGKKVANVESTTKTMVSEDYFMVHPAFTDEVENGGWSSQISGIWVGKYEASLTNKEDESNIVPDSSNADILLENNTDKTIATRAGCSSWRYIAIGKMYDNAKYYSTDLESHMLKNSEWGAVAYLTESTYGRNGNETGLSGKGYITGGGEENAYTNEENQLQSTTGNVYGVYDMRGGTTEYVAIYYNEGNSLSNGSSFAFKGGTSNQYATAYTGINESSAYKYGDATYETSGWHSDRALFVSSSNPFFRRGGYYGGVASDTGVFCYSIISGVAHIYGSFRVALVV